MMSAIFDHLWQSTLVALALGLLTVVFRKARAAVRHGLWFIASVKFLVPFIALEALGKLLAPAIRSPVEAGPEAVLIARAAAPFSQSYSAAPVAHAASAFDPALILIGVWALGFAAVLVVWMVSWARVRVAQRSATPLAWPAPMPVQASSGMLEPGLVGLWRPVLLVPASLFDRLDQPEIAAIVAHEACHLRRRDNLTAAIHMLVEALVWFHPMVWWIGARLIDERERACDEAVVRTGHDPAAYARSLVECCRLYLQSPLACMAGASGSDLRARVKRIMTAPASSPLSATAKALLLAAGLFAIATPVAAGLLASPAGRQAAARATAMVASFTPVRIDHAPAAHKTGAAEPMKSAEPKPVQAPDGAVAPPPAPEIAASQAEPAQAGPAAQDAGRPLLAELQIRRPEDPVVSPAAAPAAVQQGPATTQSPAPAEVKVSQTTRVAEDPDQTTCKLQPVTGSRFQRRVCMTRMEWFEQQRRVADFKRRLDDSEIDAFFY